MGQSAAETVKEIEEVRARLTSDLDELQERLPSPVVWAKRAVGVVVGGGVVGSVALFMIRRKRMKRARSQPAQTVVNLVPNDVAKAIRERFDDERWRQVAMGVGAAWALFRLAELRQLRRMRAAMLAPRR